MEVNLNNDDEEVDNTHSKKKQPKNDNEDDQQEEQKYQEVASLQLKICQNLIYQNFKIFQHLQKQKNFYL